MNGCKVDGCSYPPKVTMGQMQDGQLAVMTGPNTYYQGYVVARCGSKVYCVGKPSGHSWDCVVDNTHEVRILKGGETIVVC